jgi:hypothetical protein
MSKIIVSGSDDTYFQVTLELIDSIRRHEDGHRLPIAIIDGGMTVDQKVALDRQGIHVVAPYVPAYVSEKKLEKRRNLVVNVSKLWLNRLFNRYDTVLWIDADAWVQDFRAVDLLFDAAAMGHLAIVPEAGRFVIDQVPIRWIMPGLAQVRSFLYKSANHARLSWKVRRNLSAKATLNAGVFALNVNAPHWKLLQAWQSTILKNGKIFTSDQLALSLVIYEDEQPVNLMSQWYNYMGPWRIDSKTRNVVEYFFPNRPVGIVHLAGQDTMRRDLTHQIEVTDIEGIRKKTSLRYKQIEVDLAA